MPDLITTLLFPSNIHQSGTSMRLFFTFTFIVMIMMIMMVMMMMRMMATLMIMTIITVPVMKMSIMVRMSLMTMLMTLLPREGLNHMNIQRRHCSAVPILKHLLVNSQHFAHID